MNVISPYKGIPVGKWRDKTIELIGQHPLKTEEIVEVTLKAWDDVFRSSIGPRRFKIGRDLFPKPQIMGFFLHELIPLEFHQRYPGLWRPEKTGRDKDLVCLSDDRFSTEIKASSSAGRIFGNRSYAKKGSSGRGGKKSKAGYYLAINFGKFTKKCKKPKITLIRFGWSDAADWRGQKSDTGQQANLSKRTERAKLLQLFPK